MRRGALYILLSMATFPALLPAATNANDAPTTGSLRLSHLFDTRPGEQPWVSAPARFDPDGPMVAVPDTSLWKAPRPTPEPTPTPAISLPDGAVLPRLPMLISAARDGTELRSQRPAFIDTGRHSTRDLPGDHALLLLASNTVNLRIEYEFLPDMLPGEPPLAPLRVLHGPGTREQFAIPAGRYRLERRVWYANDLSRVLSESYTSQLLHAGHRYEFVPTEPDEARLTQRLPK